MQLAAFRPSRGARPMGPPDVVRRAIDNVLADVDWSDPRCGLLDAGVPVLEMHLVLGTAGYPEGHGKIEKFHQTTWTGVLRGLCRPEIDPEPRALELRLQAADRARRSPPGQPAAPAV